MTEKTQVPTPEQVADAIIADWLYSPYLGRDTKQPELRKAIATAITQAEERGRQQALQNLDLDACYPGCECGVCYLEARYGE